MTSFSGKSFSGKSFTSTTPIRTLEFPKDYENFNTTKPICTLRYVGARKPKIMKTKDIQRPRIVSVPPFKKKSSSIISSEVSPTQAKKPTTQGPSQISTSVKLVDTAHAKSTGIKKVEFMLPCPDSVVIGAPKPYVGVCPPGNLATIKIPSKKKFTLTEDPRKKFCLKNPQLANFKPIVGKAEHDFLREVVKTAGNVVTSSSEASVASSICEVIDFENPYNLDYQGLDYKNTFAKDEQSFFNQIEYRKIRRYKHRRNLKVETIINTEREQREERTGIPKDFEVDNPIPFPVPPPPPTPVDTVFGKLIRAENKPAVRDRLQAEEKKRKDRYKSLFLRKQKADEEQKLKEQQRKEQEDKETAWKLANKDIEDFVKVLDRTFTTKHRELRELPKRREFPHTIGGAIKFRHDLKKSKRIIKDQAKVKQEYYEEIGKPKKIPEAQIEVSSESPSPSEINYEDSSDDEDDMEVGPKTKKFFLRGFQYKLGPEIRGKFHHKQLTHNVGTVKGCMTREEWFETLVSKRIGVDPYNQKPPAGMDIFPPAFGLQKLDPKSPIREFRNKPLGRHYDRRKGQKLRIKRPRYIKPKKFNLIGYLYGIRSKRKRNIKASKSEEPELDDFKRMTLGPLTQQKAKKTKQNRRRMRYLGLPIIEKQAKEKFLCEDSDSGSSDWVPPPHDKTIKIDGPLPIEERCNMPASYYRELTLRVHPRHPRDYIGERIPSAVFDEYVTSTNVPVLAKPKPEIVVPENVRKIQKTEYGDTFEARHHHEHWDPTQHQDLEVIYPVKVTEPKLKTETKVVRTKGKRQTFDKAHPVADGVIDTDFVNINVDFDALIKGHRKTSEGAMKSKIVTEEDEIQPAKDTIFHSLEEGELQDFPGREQFVEFLAMVKAELNKRAGLIVKDLAIDKDDYIKELQEDLQSIESCLTSLSSSACTNLTNDSGSFLMAGDKKIPLDYLRKSLIPFEESPRKRFQAYQIDPAIEENDPFRTVPFAGQGREQVNMAAPGDSFFTFNTRTQNGLRLRLEVKPQDRKKHLLGPRRSTKAIAQVATDIDELYVEGLRNRPPFHPFKWNSCRVIIKEALRNKFESMLIQGEIVRTKIYDRRNEYYFEQMMQMKELFEKLFAKWEKKEYDAAMEAVNKVKPYYEATDRYRLEVQELTKTYTILNMEIVYIENDWMQRIILQNFHYLLAEMEWRVENDWIHRTESGELENYDESIAKRSTTNIRERGKDDAWEIKQYYDNVYLPNQHPIIVVFENPEKFILGIESLKAKTFILLLELHYTLWILAELEQKFQEFKDWCTVELESKKTYAENKCANKYFMEDRANQLKSQVDTFLGAPIDVTFSDRRMCQMRGVVAEVYRDVVPVASQMEMSALEKVGVISQVLLEVIDKFETIDFEYRRRVEKRYRKVFAHHQSLSRQAVMVERRIAAEMIQVRRNLQPPYKKPKREGKLPRSVLKKVVKRVERKEIVISEKTKFFFRAFHDEDTLIGENAARESLQVIDTIQESIVPFYFDYFLSLHGYQPNYNFKTQVELRDGPELARLKVKRLLPEVVDKYEKWLATKKKIMDETISRHPEMYRNVQS